MFQFRCQDALVADGQKSAPISRFQASFEASLVHEKTLVLALFVVGHAAAHYYEHSFQAFNICNERHVGARPNGLFP